ncbi:MAG: histidine phosphatase family protein [Bacillota bacterium]|nr:histidine phosphatase family protein [Bacillota bacterium]MDW7685236.1 histidine phosphatase family protein [Bacillota bacterium]
MQIILARHGQTTANAEKRFQGHRDYPLNAVGQQQARQLAPLLAQYAPGRIFTSDLIRSVETARPAAGLLGLQPKASPVFREYCWGELEGLSWPEIKERYPALFTRLRRDLRSADIPGQEPQEAFHRRIREGLSLLLNRHNPPTVALVGHGRYLNALVVEFLGLDFSGPWPFSFSSAAVTVLNAGNHTRRLIKFNEECHLTGEQYD